MSFVVSRKATAYCSVCRKLVVLNNQDKIMYHITNRETCPGSDKKGTPTSENVGGTAVPS